MAPAGRLTLSLEDLDPGASPHRDAAAGLVQTQDPGDSSGEATPVPIPNTEVKLSSAEDTERAAFRENRSSPGSSALSGARSSSTLRASPPRGLRYPSQMTAPGGRAPIAPSKQSQDAPTRLASVCPYLLAAGGGWRSAQPVRDQRCTAVDPPTPVASVKQRRLCLTDGHAGCATFLAANEVRVARLGGQPAPHRALARTAPLVLDRAGPRLEIGGPVQARRLGQVGLVGVMAVAFGAIVLARGGGGGTTAGRSTGPAPTASAAATAAPTASPTQEPTESPRSTPTAAPTGIPSSAPSSAPTLFGGQTYRVVAGDTLSRIAARFGTTVKAIQELNEIPDPRLIRVGQVIRIP